MDGERFVYRSIDRSSNDHMTKARKENQLGINVTLRVSFFLIHTMPSRADDNIENAVAALESGDINKYSPSLFLIIPAHWYLQKQTS